MAQDIFSEINNAVLDLQASQLQTYERPLKKLAQLLRHPSLEPFNAKLTEGLDLEAFIAESEKSGGSMVGSAQLVWPDDTRETLGLTMLLIENLAADPDYAANFGHHFFYSGRTIIAGIHAMTNQLIFPFVRDYKNYVHSKGNTEIMLKPQFSRKVFIVHGHDDGARETVARFLERIGLEAIILHEQANQGRTVIEKVIANSDVGFAVVLLTPDDEGCEKGGSISAASKAECIVGIGIFYWPFR